MINSVRANAPAPAVKPTEKKHEDKKVEEKKTPSSAPAQAEAKSAPALPNNADPKAVAGKAQVAQALNPNKPPSKPNKPNKPYNPYNPYNPDESNKPYKPYKPYNPDEPNTPKQIPMKPEPKQKDTARQSFYVGDKPYSIEQAQGLAGLVETDATKSKILDPKDQANKTNDGTLSQGELTAAQANMKKNDIYDERVNVLNAGFKEIDTDENGLLTHSEIKSGLNIKMHDGSIDPFKQGGIGNCFLLSSINSVNNDKEGKDVLKKSIKNNGDGSYNVTFAGDKTHKSYQVTDAMLSEQAARGELSRGDKDTQILEAAGREYYRTSENGRDINLGGSVYEAQELLTGQKSKVASSKSEKEAVWDKMLNDKDGISVVFGGRAQGDGTAGADIQNHAYAVKSVTADSVTYSNPWFSGKEFTMSKESFLNMKNQVGFQEVEAPQPASKPKQAAGNPKPARGRGPVRNPEPAAGNPEPASGRGPVRNP
ncbi:C2 family cysteine protease [Vampirovibrio sp.]|uniref:C2 family cysteine protease n=1 Tax=Vampirovibrio sp. TaxID=2717857 RepID=UPI0035941104